MRNDYDLIVIGGGSGGVRCARVAAMFGARVAIIESQHWGGTCVNLGCVPKKIMVQASEYPGYLQDSIGFGWSTLSGRHDWGTLMSAIHQEIRRLNSVYVSLLENVGVKVIHGYASFLDAHTVQVAPSLLSQPSEAKSFSVTSERIVVATGSKPARLSCAGAEMALVSDDMFHLENRPERICIIGAGFVGVEFAGILSRIGSEAHLVYRDAAPLKGFDPELCEHLAQAIDEAGVRRYAQSNVKKIIGVENGQKQVQLHDGRQIEADYVLMAIGRKPNIQGLGLENTNVQLSSEGRIIVNSMNETAENNIFALGDVSNTLNLTPVAVMEGQDLANRLFNGQGSPWSLATTPKAVFFTPPVASVGLGEHQITEPAYIYTASFRPMRHVISGRNRKTFMKLVVDKKSHLILGVHILGDDGPEMIQGFAVALTGKLTKEDFDRTVGLHPSSAEEFVTMRTPTREATPFL